MGCVRKRGKSWNAQVRIAGWKSFTKSFKSKTDAVCWLQQTQSACIWMVVRSANLHLYHCNLLDVCNAGFCGFLVFTENLSLPSEPPLTSF